MIIKDEDIISIEKQIRKNGGPRTVYVIKCQTENCKNILKIRKSDVKNKLGVCLSCQNKKRPFESIYNGFLKTAKETNRKTDITFEDFLEYTKIKFCHYCKNKINWIEYGTVNGENISRSYFLDRKDSSINYYKINVVVCCTRCNRGKNSLFSYEEWFGMTKFLRDKI